MMRFHGDACTLYEIKIRLRCRWQEQHSRGIITAMGHDFTFYFN